MSLIGSICIGLAKAKFGAVAGGAIGTVLLGPGVGTVIGAKIGAVLATGSVLGVAGLDGLEGAVSADFSGPDVHGNYPGDIHGNHTANIHGNSPHNGIHGEGPKDIWGRGLRPS